MNATFGRTGAKLSRRFAASTMLAGVGDCRAAPSRRAQTPLVIARDMDINSLDPARAFCDTCQIYLSSVYERLVDLGKDNKTIVPLLADEMGESTPTRPSSPSTSTRPRSSPTARRSRPRT